MQNVDKIRFVECGELKCLKCRNRRKEKIEESREVGGWEGRRSENQKVRTRDRRSAVRDQKIRR